MKKILFIFLLFVIGCAGPQGPQGAPGTIVTIAPTTIQQIVDSENNYRASLGEAPFTQGLSCTVQAIKSGTYLYSGSAGYVKANAIQTTGTIYQYTLSTALDQEETSSGGNSLLPVSIQPIFEGTNYKIVCSGQLVVTTDGYHSFTVGSDDGAVLFIDGSVVTDNDGAHGFSVGQGTKALESAITHSFQILYAQSAGGSFGLTVDMDGYPLPGVNYYH